MCVYDACMTTVRDDQSSPWTGDRLASSASTERRAAVDSVLMALMSVGRLVRHRIDGDVLDPGSTLLLKNLHSRGTMRISELASHLNLDASTVSRHVSQLQGLGLVERTGDPEDGRAYLLGITEEGETKLLQSFERRRALLASRIESWPGEDLDQLASLLYRFVADIETNITDLESS